MQAKIRQFEIKAATAPGEKLPLYTFDFLIGDVLVHSYMKYTKREICESFNISDAQFSKYLKK